MTARLGIQRHVDEAHAALETKTGKSSNDEPWFRRFRSDGSMEADAARGNNGEVLILENGWAASFKNGVWQHGFQFLHDQIADFSPVQNRDEVHQLLDQAKAALVSKS